MIVYPEYSSNSLVNVPHTILRHFSAPSSKQPLAPHARERLSGSRNLILFLIDGLGSEVVNKVLTKVPVLNRLSEKNLLHSITSVFPSTTAAALTTVHSGLTPKEHGILEWNLYFQEVQCLMESLPNRPVSTTEMSDVHNIELSPQSLFSGTTIYQHLQKARVKSIMIIPLDLIGSTYVNAIGRGARILGYKSLSDLFSLLLRVLISSEEQTYIYVYWPDVDSTMHIYGTKANESREKIFDFFHALERFIRSVDTYIAEQTGCILTSDHGFVDINPDKALYLNMFEELTRQYKTMGNGIKMLPFGGPRDVFLAVKESSLFQTVDYLKNVLKDFADVIYLNDQYRTRFFGKGKEHSEFNFRLGNILILPRDNNSIWYEYLPNQRLTSCGHHGGLSQDEMMVPFVGVKLIDMKS